MWWWERDKGGKSYFVTFINDFSQYTKVYLIRHKDEVFNMFLSYKAIENQLKKNRREQIDQTQYGQIIGSFYI